MKNLTVVLALFAMAFITQAQPQQGQEPKLKVFIDCSSTWCDMQFVRTEINVVDFMLDRLAADVHVLVTSLQNGSGGRQYQLIFYGQNKFKNLRDTLSFTFPPVSTDFEQRDGLVKYLKMGLAPLVAKTSQAASVSINMKAPENIASASPTATRDPWNYWVFRFGLNGQVSMDKVYKSNNFNENFRINRITDQLKVQFAFNAGQNYSSFEYDTDTGPIKVEVKNENYSFNHLLVRSINPHWSYGYETGWLNNTFRNYRSSFFFLPQLEYSVFPYSDVNTKYITFRYGVGVQDNRYYETTLYGVTEEMLGWHSAQANISFNQKWGTINSGLIYRNFFHDWKINNLSLSTQLDVRLTGNLTVYAYLFGSIVHDQIYLPSGGATEAEVLSRRRQLESSYNFNAWFGLSYRFGSRLNNFINPRFNSFSD
jgi:hypothetical protein